jgi:hypothetical protein
VATQLWSKRRLIGIIDACNVMHLACAEPAVETDRVPLFTYGQRGIYMHFRKFSNPEARFISSVTIWRNGSHQDDNAMPGEKAGNVCNTVDVLIAVGFVESQISVKMLPEVVCIEHFCTYTEGHQLNSDRTSEGAFSGCAQTGEPDCQTCMVPRRWMDLNTTLLRCRSDDLKSNTSTRGATVPAPELGVVFTHRSLEISAMLRTLLAGVSGT